MGRIMQIEITCLAVVTMLATCGLPSNGFCVGAIGGLQDSSEPGTIYWVANQSPQDLDEVLSRMTAAVAGTAAPRYFGAFGLIGVSRDAASQRELTEFAERLAGDRRFRELVVRHVSKRDCGVQFVFTGENVDHSIVRELIGKFRRRFGQKSITLVNISSVGTSEPGPRALGIVTFRPLE